MLGRWPAGVQALRDAGARLVDASGHEARYPVTVADDPADCRGCRYALVLVKSWQTERAGRDLAECLAEDGLALTLQNGLGNREMLASRLGADRVLLGSTTTGATLLGPGLVKPGGEGKVSIEAHADLEPLCEALQSAGFKIEIVQDASSLVWKKLVINSAINPLTALLRVSNGQLLRASIGPRNDAGARQRDGRSGLRGERGTGAAGCGQDGRKRRAAHRSQSLVHVPGRPARGKDGDRRHLRGCDSRRKTTPHCDAHESGVLAIDRGPHGKPGGAVRAPYLGSSQARCRRRTLRSPIEPSHGHGKIHGCGWRRGCGSAWL